MTTQTKLSDPIEGVQAPIIKQHFSLPLAVAILLLGVLLGVFATTLTTAKTEIVGQNTAGRITRDFPARPSLLELEMRALTETEANKQRAIEAEAARYTSMGMFYAAGNEANPQRAIEAETGRYSGMAKFYMTEEGLKTHRAIEAEAARYKGLVDFYRAEAGPGSLAWPPRPTQFYPAEKAIVTLAENALAMYHQSEWGLAQPHNLAWPPRPTQFYPAEKAIVTPVENALAMYHLSEWGNVQPHTLAWPARPTQFRPIENMVHLDQNTLAAYYQSEWGRTPSTVLPITENEVNADQDIGLMEFFTGQQRVIETDADQDIGLMEFFTVPDESRSQQAKPGTLLELHNE